ncbi:MAG TPA: hypothetical protein VND96_07330 [Candidatus Micrarchaeaceae archaeon]|nr:hypothetical protein [Candidatus Micrarchaeaceae archaeon]
MPMPCARQPRHPVHDCDLAYGKESGPEAPGSVITSVAETAATTEGGAIAERVVGTLRLECA